MADPVGVSGPNSCMGMTDRHFTLQEAQAQVPWLQETLDAIEPLKAELGSAKERIQGLMTRTQSNGGARAEKELEEAIRVQHEAEDRIDELAYAIFERGIFIKSLEQGLVDFPSMRDGREVYLCWLTGEPEVLHWHEVDAGFAGRMPL